MPTFSYATLAQTQAALAARLYNNTSDATQQQWTPSELTLYIVESLRTWNALTGFWRAPMPPITLQQGVNWYDLRTVTGSLRPQTVTDQYMMNVLESHLLEPLTPLVPGGSPVGWVGSGQFALSDLMDAWTRRQNDTLGTSGCTITRSIRTAPLSRSAIVLSDSTIDIRRIAWLPVKNQGFDVVVLRQTDLFGKKTFSYNWTTNPQQPPKTWMQSAEQPPQFDVDSIPPVNGEYEVLSVSAGAVTVNTQAQLLSVPDDWSWVPKWGSLVDLLGRESLAKDSLRAQYCQQRYKEALALMKVSGVVLDLQLNGLPINVDAVKNGDSFNYTWQSYTQGTPKRCYVAGWNLIAFPTPSVGPYSAQVTVVQNAPVPVNAVDFIQIARSDYDAMLDYAQHLAMFKVGGQEFLKTVGLYQGFLEKASLYNSKVKVMGQFPRTMYRMSNTEEERNPRVEVAQ